MPLLELPLIIVAVHPVVVPAAAQESFHVFSGM